MLINGRVVVSGVFRDSLWWWYLKKLWNERDIGIIMQEDRWAGALIWIGNFLHFKKVFLLPNSNERIQRNGKFTHSSFKTANIEDGLATWVLSLWSKKAFIALFGKNDNRFHFLKAFHPFNSSSSTTKPSDRWKFLPNIYALGLANKSNPYKRGKKKQF